MRKRLVGRVDLKWLLLVPAFALLLLAFAVPLLSIVPDAFGGDVVRRFLRIVGSPVYRTVIWTTLRVSLEATAFTLVISLPLAWSLSQARGVPALLLGLLVLVPFLTNVLVRTYAWVAILGQRGFVNAVLLGLGMISQPLPLLFSEPAVLLALVQCSIPMMVFALVTVLRRIDVRILLAANTLGANRLRAFLDNVLPMAVRGIQSGVTITFLFTMATFIAPAFLGNQRQQMLAQVIQSELDSGSDWAFAAALGVTLAAVATVVVLAIAKAGRRLSRWQRPTAAAATLPRAQERPIDQKALGKPVGMPKPRIRLFVTWRGGARLVQWSYFCLVSVFILIPLFVLIPVSFSSASALVFPPPGYSLRWFEQILGSPEWVAAGLTSLRIAAATCLLSLILAVATVLGMGPHCRIRGIAEAMVLSPLSVPAVVYALGAYLAFARVGLVDTETGIVLAHTVLVFPVTYLVVAATYSSIDLGLHRAAATLGADPLRVFTTVLFPLLLPGLAVGALLATLLSFDESVVSIFLSNLSVVTLPRKLWEGIRFDSSPEPAAVSVVLLAVTCVGIAAGIAVILGRKKKAVLPL